MLPNNLILLELFFYLSKGFTQSRMYPDNLPFPPVTNGHSSVFTSWFNQCIDLVRIKIAWIIKKKGATIQYESYATARVIFLYKIFNFILFFVGKNPANKGFFQISIACSTVSPITTVS